LLHLEGADIDIALDNCTGADFAEKVLLYEKEKNLPDKDRTIGRISANPDKSKHLETATTHIYGESIDFVNLRSEEYAEDSNHRIPSSIKLGTPVEDAFRRDLTINSMFYNINESKVEDFTGKGIDDLKLGIIRTPLAPLTTFLDDPLRVLRSVRFAATFNFVVADELIEAAKDPQVAKALEKKVSRERVGIEIAKMLRGKDPVGAMSLLNEMNVVHIVFNLSGHVPKSLKEGRVYNDPIPLNWSTEQWENSLFRMRFAFKQALKLSLPEDQRAEILLASLLSNIVPRKYLPDVSMDTQKAVSEGLLAWCDNLICTSLKLPQRFAYNVAHILYGAHVINTLLLTKESNVDNWIQRYNKHVEDLHVQIGHYLRIIKGLYSLSCILASVYDTKGIEFTENEKIYLNGNHHHGELFEQAIKNLYNGKFINVIGMKPILDGSQIASIAQIKPGNVLGHIIKDMINWQLQNFAQIAEQNEDMNKKLAEQWLQSHKEEYRNFEQKSANNKKNVSKGKNKK